MKKNRTLKIGSALLLTTSILFAGCSEGNSGSADPKDSGKTEGKESAKPAVKPKITVSVYDRGSIPPKEGNAEDNRWTRWINENGPAEVDFVTIPRWESLEKFNVLFASGSAPDLIFEFSKTYRDELIAQKQLLPLNDLIEKHSVEYKAMLEKYPILRKLATREDGKMYEFGRLNGLVTNHLMFIRKDWLDKLGLEVPKTTDDLYKVAEAFVNKDPDGNGKKDTLSMNVTFVGGYVLNEMFQDVGYKVMDGKLVRTWENSVAKNTFIKKLYDNSLIDKDFLTDKGEKAKQDFINGKLGVYFTNGAEGYAVFKGLKGNVPDANVMAIELPASEFGQFGPLIGNPAQGTAAINAKAKDPVTIMKYVDFMVRESTMKTLNYGIEGEHYAMDPKGCPKPIDVEKNKVEQAWTGDMRMLVSSGLFGDCAKFQNTLDPKNKIDAEYINILNQAEAAYLNPKKPFASLTHSEHMPALPKDLQLIVTNTTEQMNSYYKQALLGGTNYTVKQADADARAFWEKAGGKAVDEWWANWYKTKSGDAILAKDLYSLQIK